MKQKRIFVIAGLPATGKSSLARALASQIYAPCFSKDGFKEIVYKTISPENRSESRQIGIACEELLLEQALSVIEHVPLVIIESTFQPEFLREFSSRARSRAIEINVLICITEHEVLLERYLARIPHRDPRHFDHPDILTKAPVLDLVAWNEIGKVQIIDTTTMTDEILANDVVPRIIRDTVTLD